MSTSETFKLPGKPGRSRQDLIAKYPREALAKQTRLCYIDSAGTKRESADTGVQGGDSGRYSKLAQTLLDNKIGKQSACLASVI